MFFSHDTAIVEDGSEVGQDSKIWHFAHVRKGAVIGKNCVIGKNVYIDAGVVIGDNVKIQNNVSVYKGVTIGNGVFVGPHVCFTNDKQPRAVKPDFSPRSEQDWELVETRVEDGASIGANATVVAGITLGKWCMIGSGAIVTRDVPNYALMVGCPSRIIGIVGPDGDIVSKEYAQGTYTDRRGNEFTI